MSDPTNELFTLREALASASREFHMAAQRLSTANPLGLDVRDDTIVADLCDEAAHCSSVAAHVTEHWGECIRVREPQ